MLSISTDWSISAVGATCEELVTSRCRTLTSRESWSRGICHSVSRIISDLSYVFSSDHSFCMVVSALLLSEGLKYFADWLINVRSSIAQCHIDGAKVVYRSSFPCSHTAHGMDALHVCIAPPSSNGPRQFIFLR